MLEAGIFIYGTRPSHSLLFLCFLSYFFFSPSSNFLLFNICDRNFRSKRLELQWIPKKLKVQIMPYLLLLSWRLNINNNILPLRLVKCYNKWPIEANTEHFKAQVILSRIGLSMAPWLPPAVKVPGELKSLECLSSSFMRACEMCEKTAVTMIISFKLDFYLFYILLIYVPTGWSLKVPKKCRDILLYIATFEVAAQPRITDYLRCTIQRIPLSL